MYVMSSKNVEVKEPKVYGWEGSYSSDVSTAADKQKHVIITNNHIHQSINNLFNVTYCNVPSTSLNLGRIIFDFSIINSLSISTIKLLTGTGSAERHLVKL